LTFCIGIRFLVKPDTTRKDVAAKGEKLDWKGVVISLFFGLTIGFGAGFVGTGGGMMMLVVFTAFLGMELKTAVGTSTFIMTFTALIASAAHMVIHPAIVLEKWDVMLLCIVVATISSLVSARFANRVNNRTVGLVTGAVLTVLGGAMLILNYWDAIRSVDLLYQVFVCYGDLLKYLAPAVCILLIAHHFIRIPDYIFRKLLHMIAFSIVTVMILSASRWEAGCLTALSFALIVYPILMLLEKEPWFDKLLVQKKPGEIKQSLLLLFVMIAVDIAVAWGLFGKQYVAVASVLMWGFGDAAAALVGIPFGKHIVPWKISDGKKTFEGTAAMFVVCALVGCAVLIPLSGAPIWQCVLAALLCAAAGALTELGSKNGMDTVTVPAVLVAMLLLLGV
jgi:dolichol kinase